MPQPCARRLIRHLITPPADAGLNGAALPCNDRAGAKRDNISVIRADGPDNGGCRVFGDNAFGKGQRICDPLANFRPCKSRQPQMGDSMVHLFQILTGIFYGRLGRFQNMGDCFVEIGADIGAAAFGLCQNAILGGANHNATAGPAAVDANKNRGVLIHHRACLRYLFCRGKDIFPVGVKAFAQIHLQIARLDVKLALTLVEQS